MRPNILMPIMIFMTRYYNRSRHISRKSSVIHKLNFAFLITLFALVALISSSCEKGILKLGDDILPNGDMVVTYRSTDTLSAFSYTMYDASFRTDNPSISFLGQDL